MTADVDEQTSNLMLHCNKIVRSVILDTNALIGLSPEQSEKLRLAEINAGYRQFADPWTLMELVARLADSDDKKSSRALAALRRCAARALSPSTEPPRVVLSIEAQCAQVLFGSVPENMLESLALLTEVVKVVSDEGLSFKQPWIAHNIKIIASDVAYKENSFAALFKQIRDDIANTVAEMSVSERNKCIRGYFTQSDEFALIDAQTLINRTYRAVDCQPPAPIPVGLIEKTLQISRIGSYALAEVFEKILCENVDLDDEGKRNLLWDQEIAANLGKEIDGAPILIVTNDRFFRAAAKRSGHTESVLKLDQYMENLGITKQ